MDGVAPSLHGAAYVHVRTADVHVECPQLEAPHPFKMELRKRLYAVRGVPELRGAPSLHLCSISHLFALFVVNCVRRVQVV